MKVTERRQETGDREQVTRDRRRAKPQICANPPISFRVWVGVYPRQLGSDTESGMKPDPHSEAGVGES